MSKSREMFIARAQSDERYVEVSEDRLRPEKNLLLGILERAIRDALGLKGVMPPDVEKHHKRDAWAWLEIGQSFEAVLNPVPFTFQWLCQHLALDPGYIHGKLREALIIGGPVNIADLYRHRFRKVSFMHIDQIPYTPIKVSRG